MDSVEYYQVKVANVCNYILVLVIAKEEDTLHDVINSAMKKAESRINAPTSIEVAGPFDEVTQIK